MIFRPPRLPLRECRPLPADALYPTCYRTNTVASCVKIANSTWHEQADVQGHRPLGHTLIYATPPGQPAINVLLHLRLQDPSNVLYPHSCVLRAASLAEMLCIIETAVMFHHSRQKGVPCHIHRSNLEHVCRSVLRSTVPSNWRTKLLGRHGLSVAPYARGLGMIPT